MSGEAWRETFNHKLVEAGAVGAFGWWRMGFPGKGADLDRTLQRVWTCGAETLEDAIANPPPAGKYLAVEACINYDWTLDTARLYWYGFLVEDGVLVRRPVEVDVIAVLNLEFATRRHTDARTLHEWLKQLKRLSQGLATRTLCWREDVQVDEKDWTYNYLHREFGRNPVPIGRRRRDVVVPRR